MKFAISLPCTGPLATGPAALDSLRIVAQKAEALGLESIWVPDHVVIPTTVNSRYPYNKSGKFPLPPEMGFLEPMTALGFLAGVTQRIRLGTSALVLPHRNPILTAKMIATLDVLSQGRIILGAGIGWMEEEISLLGAPFKRRGALSDEYLRAMRELWTNPDPQFEGEFCRFSGIKCEPKPVQKPLQYGLAVTPTERCAALPNMVMVGWRFPKHWRTFKTAWQDSKALVTQPDAMSHVLKS